MAKGNPKILKFGAWRGEDTRGHAVAFLRPYRGRLATVRVDADGVGYNFGLHLRDQDLPVELVHVGIPVESKPNLRADDPALRFLNQKAQLYQHLADLLERDGIDGLVDDTTIGQLAGILYEIDPRGRIMIESKEKARQRGVQSPDRAEALMLALGKPHQFLNGIRFANFRIRSHPFTMAQTMTIAQSRGGDGMFGQASSDSRTEVLGDRISCRRRDHSSTCCKAAKSRLVTIT